MENKNLSGGTAEAVQNLNARITWNQIKEANRYLDTIDLKGKDYVQVYERIKGFRMVCPDGCIKTDIVSLENDVVTMKAQVFDGDKNLLGTGHARELKSSSFVNKTSYIENCETSAVGRALGMVGIGIDASMASAEEVANAILNQGKEESKPAASKKPEPAKKAEPIDEPPKEKPASPIKKDVDEWMKENKLDRATMVKFICDYMPQERQKALKEEHKFNNFSELNNRTLASYYLQIEKPKEQPCLNT